MARWDGRIVILTGAGISKESGLDTFRDADGIWSKVNLEDVATPEGYLRNPAMVQEFYNSRRRGLLSDNIRPNAAHEALARLERDWADEVLLVTQNIDNLHERAGSRNRIHMHGELLKVRCEACGQVSDCETDITVEESCASCDSQGTTRPHVVWFGEMPFDMDRIYAALSACDLFISIGTSGNVYPAAGFVQEARLGGRAHTIELNLEPSEGATLFSEAIYGPASQVVPAYVDRLLKEGW
ncbi:MAG: NAD-dependent protein deacylase [Alphaproteobacteria bacterium]|nr:NAD-dependent protein deacylase [Alphaproteobacteria bacterium]